MGKTGLILAGLVLGITACTKMFPGAPPENELLDGPLPGLSGADHIQFLAGDVAFNDEIFTGTNGLGPLFVATSCGSCHAGDGKGHPFTTLTRFGQTDSTGNLFLHQGGPQLQNRAIPGFQPELLPPGAAFSSFTPPANTGLGFLDAVTDGALLALADADDANGDGISGRPNWHTIPNYIALRPGTVERNGKYIGRFGKKAATYNLLQQTVNAYNQDMGVTSSFEPIDSYTGLTNDPEVSDKTVNDVVFYLKTLKAPLRRNESNPEVKAGEQIFGNLQCGSCHLPTMQTGYSPIAALSEKTFHPFTDLLLHDMGPGLDDGYTEGTATTAEWRTPALWGLGLSKKSQGGQYFLLHDGRAKTIEDAVLLHGGEAKRSRDLFEKLSSTEKQKLIRFLESL